MLPEATRRFCDREAPGIAEALRRCMNVFGPVMEHALRMIRGEGHP